MKGNAIMIALGKSKGSESSMGDQEESMDDESIEPSETETEAAQELIDAIKSGDAKLVAMAFKNLKHC